MISVRQIISGGQTGVDRAAFDAAIKMGLEIGGFVPKNRLAEDARVPKKYKNLIETETPEYKERTRLNVVNSDATLILSNGELAGGSKLTEELAKRAQKPVLHLDFQRLSSEELMASARRWLDAINPKILNIAGPRASSDVGIYKTAFEFLSELLKRDEVEPHPRISL